MPQRNNKNAKINDNLNLLVNSSDNLLFVTDVNGIIENINDTGVQLLQFEKEEIIGRHFTDFFSKSSKNLIAEKISSLIKSNSEILFTSSIYSKFGNEIKLDVLLKPCLVKEKLVGIMCRGSNITEKTELSVQIEKLKQTIIEQNRIIELEKSRGSEKKSVLDELNKLKNEFISNISHELRTPLASIIGFSETMLYDSDITNEMRLEFSKIILNEGKRLAKLVNDILDVSKLEVGTLELAISEFDIAALINEIIESHKESIQKKGIIINTEFPDADVLVNADKERISQAIGGLITNAIKFNNQSGRIKIILNDYMKEIEINVIDTGIGIHENDIPFIFNKFYRVDRNNTEPKGTGLGLVLVKQIIDLHRGIISVQSEMNKGAAFTIKLPKNINITSRSIHE
ncbi:MAG TPA: PAS domain-containing sensor histidine kinase [Ignavibacteriaceae bacterium]|nr:PAS domain-containing sensor histidine kinase [Ignavibacteriaceae bacterium]